METKRRENGPTFITTSLSYGFVPTLCRTQFCAGLLCGFFFASALVLCFIKPVCVNQDHGKMMLAQLSSGFNNENGTTAQFITPPSLLYDDHLFNGDQTCSFDLIYEYYRVNKAMPEGGKWSTKADSLLGEEYRPSLCQFGKFNPFSCLKKKNIQSILTIGDSQVWRYTDALIEFLNNAGGNCTKIKVAASRTAQRIEYYSINNWTLNFYSKSSERPLPYTAKCIFPDGQTLQIEYNSIYFFIEPSVVVKGLFDQPTAMTFHEFLFNHYLKNRKIDLMLLVPPFNHIKYAQKVKGASFNNYIEDFVELVLDSIPRSTPIHWITTTAELEAARNQKAIVFHNARYEGMLATDKIYLMNRRLYEVLQPKLLDHSYNFHGFFNMHNISSVRTDWGFDGVHLQPIWYNKTVEHFLATFCNT